MSALSPRTTYDQGLAAGELRYQQCRGCSFVVFYPRTLCPSCGSSDLEWRRSAGVGSVYSTTTVVERNHDDYNVCLVDLDEGFRMMSRVLGNPWEVAIGDRVRVDFIELSGQLAAVFRKDEAS
jgi:uncharacterized OB-fold protein